MNTHMLLFSLGPVQPFIAQARKTRDLWIGSLLLSKLMRVAIADIKDHIIFPIIEITDDLPGIPNKYIALFSAIKDAQEAALQSELRIREHWNGIQQKMWKEIIASDGDQYTSTIWQRQTAFSSLFEIYWVIGERQEDMDYGKWLDETESLFAARKRLRDFRPQEEPGEKSAISGEREVLRTELKGSREFWKTIAAQRRLSSRDIDLDGKERLDAIDTIKRFAMQKGAILAEQPFPSTSTIATASFIERMLDCDSQREAFLQWNRITKGNLIAKKQNDIWDVPYLAQKASQNWQWLLRLDGDLYFPAIFAERSLKSEYRITESEGIIKAGKKALTVLLQEADALKITRPTPYYAVIQMDGDNMGVLLSGTKDDKEHKAISSALSEFAHKIAPDLIEQQYPARLVYAGGDDVLAFAPLARDITDANKDQPQSILELAHTLQKRYQNQVKDPLLSLQPPPDEKRIQGITASMGIAIAHHYTSLSYVLRSAHAAEDAAKRQYNRNALVVTILRRSGEQTQVGCHWYYPQLEDDGQPIQMFSQFFALFKKDTLSPKCVYILLNETAALVGISKDGQASEVKRVLVRQLDLRQKNDEEKATLKGQMNLLALRLVQLAGAMDDENAQLKQEGKLSIELHSAEQRYGIVEVMGWLLVMAFLARKDQESE